MSQLFFVMNQLFFERDMVQLLHESRSTYRKAKERAFLLAVERDMVISLKVHRMLGFRVFGKWPRYLRMLCHRLCQYHGFDCVAEKPADPNDQTFYRELGLQVFKKPGVSRCREPSICRMALHVCGSKCMNGQTGGSASFGSLWGDPLWDPAYQKREKIPGVTQPTYVDRLLTAGWKVPGRREKSPAEETQPREQQGGGINRTTRSTTHQSVGPERTSSSSSASPSEKQRTRATTTEVLEEDLKLLDEQDGLQPRDDGFSRQKQYNHAGAPRAGRGQLYHQEKGSSSTSSGSAPITAQQKGWRRITSGTTNWETRGAGKGGKAADKDDAKAGKGSAAAPGAGGGAGAGGASSRGKSGKMNIIGKRQNSEAEPPQSAENSAAEKPSTGQRQQPHPQESSAGTTESKTTKSSSKTGGGGSGEGGAGEERASSDGGEKEEKSKRRAHEKRLLLEQKAKLARLVGIDSQNDPSNSSERKTKSGQHRGWDLLQQLVGLVSCAKRRQE